MIDKKLNYIYGGIELGHVPVFNVNSSLMLEGGARNLENQPESIDMSIYPSSITKPKEQWRRDETDTERSQEVAGCYSRNFKSLMVFI